VSLRQKVRLEYEKDGEDAELVVEYSAIDLRAWEASFHESALAADMSVSMLTWLGHHAAVRQGQLNGPLRPWKSFDEVCFSVEGVRDEEGPTKPPRKAATPKTATDESSAP
jgi:hypothetical protein